MNLTPPKLKPLHIGIIAALLAIVIGAATAYFWIMPMMKENQEVAQELEQLETRGAPARLDAAKKKVLEARAEQQQTNAAWANRQRRYFLIGPNRQPIDLSRPFETQTNIVAMEHRRTLIPILEGWARRNNVLISGLQLGAANTNPNSLQQFENQPYRLDFQNVNVTGTFNQILRMLNSTEGLPRLVSIRNVALTSAQSSTSEPTLVLTDANTVTANLSFTVYIFTQGKFEKDSRFPDAAQQGQGAGGIMPGGGPPMPGMMPGGGPPIGPAPMPGGGPPVGPAPMPGGGPPIGPAPMPGGGPPV